jgi:hypothetical protein
MASGCCSLRISYISERSRRRWHPENTGLNNWRTHPRAWCWWLTRTRQTSSPSRFLLLDSFSSRGDELNERIHTSRPNYLSNAPLPSKSRPSSSSFWRRRDFYFILFFSVHRAYGNLHSIKISSCLSLLFCWFDSSSWRDVTLVPCCCSSWACCGG